MGGRRHGRRVLPGAFFFLREKQLPPMELLRRHNVRIAISTD
jgi:imidazolonepropionase